MLTGRSAAHVVDCPEFGTRLQPIVRFALQRMQRAAREVGIELTVASGFRDFTRQCTIWNGKFRGEREVLDALGRPVDMRALDDDARIDAILQWSALPGASRHHWGTDFDVYDRTALDTSAGPRLIPEEYAAGGPFARLSAWLERRAHEFGFFRPYASDRGGVRPEAWHLSFAPESMRCLDAMSPEILAEAISSASIEGQPALLGRLPILYTRFVQQIDRPSLAASAFELRDDGRMV